MKLDTYFLPTLHKGLLFVFLCCASLAFSQKNTIAQLLNQQFSKEQKMYPKGDYDIPILAKAYRIENDTLSYTVVQNPLFESEPKTWITRKVALQDITAMIRDYEIIFYTQPDAVYVEKIIKSQEGVILQQEHTKLNTFHTELRKDQKDQTFKTKLVKAFQKAGFMVPIKDWYY